MNDLLEYLSKNHVGILDPSTRIFLEFKYPEARDLLKHFLTLISASLVFSVTFSEKIVQFSSASLVQKSLLVGSWGTLVLALGACGIGIYTLYLAAEQAFGEITGASSGSFQSIANMSYVFQDLAGILFGLGMALMVAAALLGKW